MKGSQSHKESKCFSIHGFAWNMNG
uniref:Uncharacterized protein n=1 Tax=Vitis vinifera TaxID=29760 RepID=F6HG04_VITVI